MTPSASSRDPSGSWDSVHVFETAERGRQAHYKLTSTVMLSLTTCKGNEADDSKKGDNWKREGEVNLSGSMTRQVRLICQLELLLIEVRRNKTGH